MVRKILSFYTKYFAVWVIICGAIAYFWPEIFTGIENGMTWIFGSTVELLLPEPLRLGSGRNWFFAMTMFGIGAVLQLDDFKRIAAKPLIVLVGCTSQFMIMPLGAFVLARLSVKNREMSKAQPILPPLLLLRLLFYALTTTLSKSN